MGGNAVAVSHLHGSVFGVASVPIGSQRCHLFIPTLKKLRSVLPDAVERGLRAQANRAVRLDPLVRNDLVLHDADPRYPYAKEAKAAIKRGGIPVSSLSVYNSF
jgi:hypothetical protein